MLFSLTVFAQTESTTIEKANGLIENKKYESAFKMLQDFDKQNENPDVVLLKEDIALNYFVTSIMHEIFAFKDLEKNEDIMDYRGKNGSFGMYNFPIDSVLGKLIKAYPENYKLYKGLGDFYYEVQQKYDGQWLKDDKTISDLIVKNYQIVIDHKLADDKVYYVIGFQYLSSKKNKEAIPYFLKSIELKNDFADAYYNLAYAYLFTDDRVNALKYAKNSLDLYKDAELKSDAARMIGQIYTELNDDKNAIVFYELADKIAPGNYYNLHPLLTLYFKTDNPKKVEMINSFYNLAPDKPTIYNDLGKIFFENNKTDELIEFYKSKLLTYKDDKKILGNLNFYLGQLFLDNDKTIAKDYFLTAKSIFSTIYDKNNQVFKAIDEGIKQTKK
jgi:tetratricopeptide (TPR) repeat protein